MRAVELTRIARIAGLVLLFLELAIACFARPQGLEKYSLVRVIDGDTIVVKRVGANAETHVRLMGIDCLESRRIERLKKQASALGITVDEALSFGKDASELVKERLSDKPIYLELEKGSGDKYGRVLAYVWTDEQDSLNVQLLRSGNAMWYRDAKFGQQDLFEAAESAARASQVGIWTPPLSSHPKAAGDSRCKPGPVATRDFSILTVILATAGIVLVFVGLRMKA